MIENKYFKWNMAGTFLKRIGFKKCKFDISIAYGEDLLYKFEIIRFSKGRVIYQPLAKYHYRIRPGSACTSYFLDKKIDDLKVLEYMMANSDSDISDLIFYKQYIPKLLNHMYESVLSENSKDNDLFTYFVDKIKQSYKRALNDSQLSISKKLKVLTCFFPLNLLRRIVRVYAYLRRQRFAHKADKF